MFPTLTKKSNLVIGGTAIIAVVIFVAFVMNGKTVPESSNGTDGVAATTPEAKSFWSSLFSKETPVVIPAKDVVKEPVTPQSPSGVQEVKSKKFWITSDVAILQGEGFFYVEGGVLYKRKDGVVGNGQKVAEGVEWVMAQDAKVILFTSVSTSSNSEKLKNELWVVDKEIGSARKVYEDVGYAQISPKGDVIAVSTEDSEVHLVNKNGGILGAVGIHGGITAFSSDGKKLAYHKLADTTSQGNDPHALSEQAYGIAIYDMGTGRESLVTNNAEDYAPIEFSLGGENLYFISGRDDSQTLWSQDLTIKGDPVRLLNEPASVFSNSLWSLDKFSVVLNVGQSISLVRVASDKKSATVAKVLGQGSAPRWKVQDKTVEFKGKDGEWKTVDVSALVSK